VATGEGYNPQKKLGPRFEGRKCPPNKKGLGAKKKGENLTAGVKTPCPSV